LPEKKDISGLSEGPAALINIISQMIDKIKDNQRDIDLVKVITFSNTHAYLNIFAYSLILIFSKIEIY